MFKKNNCLIVLILFAGLFFRAWHPLQLFQYSHDQDLAGWFVRDVLINHHLRLIGQETSSHGIFIGPYFYYLQIPFYLLTHLDPAGALLLPIILGVFAIFSIYFVFAKMFNVRVALIGALVYAMSTLIIFTDREVAPTMPVMLWTIWFMFGIWQILKGKEYGYLLIGFLIGLIWSINLQLIILLPLVLLAQIFSKKKISLKYFFAGSGAAIIFNIPFMAFEIRHGFQQTKSLILSLTTSKDYISGTSVGFLAKLDRTMQLVYKNTTNLFKANTININAKVMFWVLIFAFIYLIWKKKINRQLAVILSLWQIVYIFFFSKVSLNLSEYYLNGMNIVWILIASLLVVAILKHNQRIKLFGFSLIGLFVILNLYSFFTISVNASGYLERKAIISYIKADSKKHNFPCVSLSFITSPGNDFGYRYFTWELGLKTKPISNNVPVYSIVFPLDKVEGFDKSFGALGLVLPEYKRYNSTTVEKNCKGSDFTTSEPMFGFTN